MNIEVTPRSTNSEQEAPACNIGVTFPKGLRLTVVGVTHTLDYFERNKNFLKEYINEASFIGVEDDSYLFNPNTPPEFYSRIIDISRTFDKPIICCDPSPEDNLGGYIDLSQGFIGAGMVFMTVSDAIVRLSSKAFTRREFLKAIPFMLGATLFVTSELGKAAVFGIKGCDTTAHHPQLNDSISFFEFRNTAMLLGYDQLASDDILTNKNGVQFIGAGHIPDLKGFTDNGVFNQSITQNEFVHNAYRLTKSPSIRIWLSDKQSSTYYLGARIPIISDGYTHS